MISVEKGEVYWSIILDEDDEPYATPYVNEGTHIDIGRLTSKNSFNTREEAEVMVRKLRAVLNGAEVIEMPSEEEIREKANNIAYRCGVGLEMSNLSEVCQVMAKWLKSKIVK